MHGRDERTGDVPPPSGVPHAAQYTGAGHYERHPTWYDHEAPWKADQVVRMMARHGLDPRSIVDVGCGTGGVLAALQPRLRPDCLLQGYDIAPAPVALAQHRANDRLRFRVADVTELPGLRADLLLVLDVVTAVEDTGAFLRAIRPMSPRALFHIPLALSVQTVLRRDALLRRRVAFGDAHYYNKSLALQVLREAGYAITDVAYTGMAVGLTDALGRLPDERGRLRPNLRNAALRTPRRLLFRLHQDLAVRILGGYHLMVLAE